MKDRPIKWTTKIPEETGWYWSRGHGGTPIIVWIRVMHDWIDMYQAGWASPTMLTPTVVAERGLEFYPKPLTKPK